MNKRQDPVLAELFRRGFHFNKNLGQNFLFDPLLLERITDAAGIEQGDTVLEAGAGAGSLTAAIAAKGANVMAVELDRTLIPYLRERFQGYAGVEIIHGDIMKLEPDILISGVTRDESVLLEAVPYKLCANLPYNISTPFITKVFRQMKGLVAGAVMVQKEVADRIVAQPGGENYGVLALAAAWFGEAEKVIAIPPALFIPSPTVDSAVIAFRRRPLASSVDEKVLWMVIRGLFNQRRKNLLNGLRSLGAFAPANGADWMEVLREAGIEHKRRPETLSLVEFVALVRAAGYTNGKIRE